MDHIRFVGLDIHKHWRFAMRLARAAMAFIANSRASTIGAM
ncbi:hypothetical protein IQ26_06702 [Mesorhizobium tianshanense]|uniref:Uncharacterized protein n=1 Tax=Mesorhizobium tianshanense TaxID=39844 RepID=A0A562MQX8_9HYPH|nr:hypothetical protein IQ26_06702 [Mesorhizobium tianshanense]